MNFIESLLSAEFIRAFAWTLFHSLWQGGLLALVAFGLMIILRKHRPAIRYVILYIVMMLLPVFFAGTFLMTYHPDKVNIETSGTTRYQDNNITSEMAVVDKSTTSRAWYAHPALMFESQAKWLVLIWFIGFFIFLLRFSGSILYVYRLRNYQVYDVDEQWDAKLRRLSERIGSDRRIKLAESALARIPMTIGYFKPVILLPLGTLSGVPPQQIDAILLHELAHILRKDYLLNIIQSVIELLFFYHPVTWWLSGLIRQEREHICDDLAIGVNQDHLNYIKALTTMEELNSKSPLLASALLGSKKRLLFRVKRLLNPVKLRKGLGEGIIAFILLISLVFTLSVNALSIIPSAYDLTGRESGENHFNFLPFNPNAIPATVSKTPAIQPSVLLPVIPESPDTIISTSRSGRVKISVYTDSTSQDQQEMLNKMAESMDEQSRQYDKAMKEYEIQIERSGPEHQMTDQKRTVVIIGSPDSTWTADSVIVFYDEPMSQSSDKQMYAFKNGLIDTIIYIGPEGQMDLDKLKEFEWSDEQLNDNMKDYEINVERDYYDADREYRDVERELREAERGYALEQPLVPSPERIIRQELRDDGLTMPGRKYVIELDTKSMYINGEKQPKEVCKKYRKLVESLDQGSLEGGETYKLIF
jgi:beta-lactamase regulating signal transducer with metallopeptidase domain